MSNDQAVREESYLDGARSPYAHFVLPTGYLAKDSPVDKDGNPPLIKDVELREITGEEEDMLASRGGDSNTKMNNLMVACTHKIGEVTDKSTILKIVKELVSNDRFFLVYKIREISLGKEYRFSAPCPYCGDDKLRFVDLSTVTFPSLPDPYKRIYMGTLPKCGRRFKWKVQDGLAEEGAQRALKGVDNNLMSAIILQRLIELDDVPATMQSVKSLPTMDRNYLRGEFDRVEGQLDDTIVVPCTNPVCGREFNTEVDIGKKEFFFPTV